MSIGIVQCVGRIKKNIRYNVFRVIFSALTDMQTIRIYYHIDRMLRHVHWTVLPASVRITF